jgi:hypothetical protein
MMDVCDIFDCRDCPYWGPDCYLEQKWLEEMEDGA